MGLFVAAVSLVLAAAPLDRHEGALGTLTVALHADDPLAVDARLEALALRGVDGVGLERPLTRLESAGSRARENELLRAVRSGAERLGRSFHVSYDVRGGEPGRWAALVRWDWANLIDGELHGASSAAWLREGGRPVVMLRGLGAPESPGTVAETMDLIDWLKDRGCYVVAAVPGGFRSGATRPNFLSAFARVDAVQLDGVEAEPEASLRDDAAWATQMGLGLTLAVDAASLEPTPDAPAMLVAAGALDELPSPRPPVEPPGVEPLEPMLARER